VLDALGAQAAEDEIFLIGSRGVEIARQRAIEPVWTSPAPSHSVGAPKLADRVAQRLFERMAVEKIDRLDVVFTIWRAGRGFQVERRRLFPLDLELFARLDLLNAPLANLPADVLLRDLTADYIHAQLCRAILQSFAAENQARLEVMAAARKQVDKMLDVLRGDERRIRQEEITEEIIELSAGERATRNRA
jgi:F-type H+-transporting ATPase subunit gamma